MSRATLAAGARIGPYAVQSLVGEGGMGQVYRARDERLARDVALKLVHADLAQDLERLKRFEHEAKAAGALNHPNIVAIYDAGLSDGSPYIVSELLTGETLRDRLASSTLGTRKSVDYAVQIARGLAAAHEKGIVHRDLKPENLFLTKDGLVKILDFGIAKLGRPGEETAGTGVETLSHTGTSAGTVLGTVGYMAPEQVRGVAADHRADIFTLGAVLLEMLTGRRAFTGTTAADALSAILREDPTESLATDTRVPAGLLRVVRRCLEKAPEDRFQTARDLAFALESATSETAVAARPAWTRIGRRRFPALAAGASALAVAFAAGSWLASRQAGAPALSSYERLTFRIGQVETARFAPDRETIVYGASWGSRPSELYQTRTSAAGSRPLGLRDATILAVSPREEMAVLLRPRRVAFSTIEGTLARVPLAGGTPREVLEGVNSADFSPDGKELAVVHAVGDRWRLEFPIGKVLYDPEPPIWLSGARVSPDGTRVAFLEHLVADDARGRVAIVGPNQPKRDLGSSYAGIDTPCWSPDGRELWLSAGAAGQPEQFNAISLAGAERTLAVHVGSVMLHDVSRSGRLLLTRQTSWAESRARARGASEESELPAADLSFLADLSDDGKQVLGTDVGRGGGPNFTFYVQQTDGSAPVWLGEGDGQALSPDGRFALAVLVHSQPQQLVVTPTGAGETRTLEAGPIVRYSRAVWHPSGERVVIAGIDSADASRLYVQDLGAGPPRAITEEGVTLGKLGRPVSPDGRRVVAFDPDGAPEIYPIDGGPPTPLPGLNEFDLVLAWTPDGRELMVARYEDTPPRVERVEIKSGRVHPWRAPSRSLPSVLLGQSRLLVSPDGESYAYGYVRRMNDLYLSSPIR